MGMETNENTANLMNQPQQPNTISREEESRRRRIMIVVGVVVVLILAALIAFLVFLLTANPGTTAQIRDVFIIFMALESLLVGLVLVILVIQIARLTNLLQNEIKPILESTNETISTLRGTTTFLSDNLVQPVIKLNEYLAAISQFVSIIGLSRKKSKNSSKTHSV